MRQIIVFRKFVSAQCRLVWLNYNTILQSDTTFTYMGIRLLSYTLPWQRKSKCGRGFSCSMAHCELFSWGPPFLALMLCRSLSDLHHSLSVHSVSNRSCHKHTQHFTSSKHTCWSIFWAKYCRLMSDCGALDVMFKAASLTCVGRPGLIVWVTRPQCG